LVGEFKDDRFQTHTHYIVGQGSNPTAVPNCGISYSGDTALIANQHTGRNGSTTRGKRKGVKYIIKVL
jgi:hypothetical protein